MYRRLDASQSHRDVGERVPSSADRRTKDHVDCLDVWDDGEMKLSSFMAMN